VNRALLQSTVYGINITNAVNAAPASVPLTMTFIACQRIFLTSFWSSIISSFLEVRRAPRAARSTQVLSSA
jgi:hypothetical protein